MCLYAWVLDVGRCADLVPVCFGVGCGVLCRFIFFGIRPAALLVMDCFEAVFCMLRYWMRNTVPIWFLYASVLDAGCCADLFFLGYGRLLYWLWIVLRPFSVCFGIGCETLCRSGSCMLRCWTWNAVPIYFYILCFFDTGQDVHSLLFSALCG